MKPSQPARHAQLPLCIMLLIVSASTHLAPAPSMAQQQEPPQDFRLELRTRGGHLFRLALPPLRALDGAETAAEEIHRVLWNDLHHSMAFELIPRGRYPSTPSPGEEPDWALWRATDAEVLILGTVRRVGDRILAELRIFDVENGQQVRGLRYNEPDTRPREIAHAFNDDAVHHYTGIPGVASTQIAFVSDRMDGSGRTKEIFIMDYDGHDQRRITFDKTITLSPTFSPGADRIAYVTYRRHDYTVNPDLYLLHKGGGTPTALTVTSGLNNAPAWSPDGEWIAFSSSRQDNPEIYVVRPDGTDVRRLTHHPASDTAPTWSPNGRQLAFTSDRSGAPQIYTMGVDGTNVRRLSTRGNWNDDPAWRPVDGDFIAFTSSTGRNRYDIFLYDLKNDRLVRLTRGPGRNEAPSWSPDGRQIVFESARGGSTQLYAMGLDGSRLRALTVEGDNLTPDWGGRP